MKVALHGSYFGFNFGDTLLCSLFNRWINEVEPLADVILPLASNANRVQIGASHNGLLRAASAECVIFCGGGYFGQPPGSGRKWAVRNYLRHVAIANFYLRRKRPLHIMGVGVGPISSERFRRSTADIFERATTVVVRDEESAQYLHDLGVRRLIGIKPDAVLGLTKRDIEENRDDLNISPDSRLLLIHFNSRTANNISTVSVIREFLANHPEVVPVVITDSVERGMSRPQCAAAEAVVKLIPNIRSFAYGGDPWRLCSLINRSSIIITNKLHVGIVGTALEKFVIALPNHTKTQRLYRQLGMERHCIVDQSRPADAVRELLAAWEVGYVLPSRAKAVIAASRYLPDVEHAVRGI